MELQSLVFNSIINPAVISISFSFGLYIFLNLMLRTERSENNSSRSRSELRYTDPMVSLVMQKNSPKLRTRMSVAGLHTHSTAHQESYSDRLISSRRCR